MGMINIRSLALGAFLLAPLAVTTTGCYGGYAVEADAPVAQGGYEPQYYDGRVVYFDTVGRPFYYNGGAQVWIPESSPYYVGYRNHWAAYGPAYNRWYAGYGYRYRGWHGRSYYGGHAGYYRGRGYRR